MVPLKIVTIHEEHPDLVRRELRELTKMTFFAIGRKWAVDLLPEHFQPSAKTIFGHAPRTPRYLKRRGHGTDLSFSGTLEEALERSRNMIRAYPTRVVIELVGPSYFTDRPRKLTKPNMVREVTAMSPRHERILGETGDRAFEAALRMVRTSRRARKVTSTGGRAAA